MVRFRFEIWIRAWIEILCAFICIITLSFYRPWWDYKFMSWSTKKDLNRKMEKYHDTKRTNQNNG